jgi:hypothetical protein
LNGPYSVEENVDNPKTADYCIGRAVIYVGFFWDCAEEALKTALECADKHKVGFFDVSSEDGAVLFPET